MAETVDAKATRSLTRGWLIPDHFLDSGVNMKIQGSSDTSGASYFLTATNNEGFD